MQVLSNLWFNDTANSIPPQRQFAVSLIISYDRKMKTRGRPVEFPERLAGPRLPVGTHARLNAVLRPEEGISEFMRVAILNEIGRREGGEGKDE